MKNLRLSEVDKAAKLAPLRKDDRRLVQWYLSTTGGHNSFFSPLISLDHVRQVHLFFDASSVYFDSEK